MWCMGYLTCWNHSSFIGQKQKNSPHSPGQEQRAQSLRHNLLNTQVSTFSSRHHGIPGTSSMFASCTIHTCASPVTYPRYPFLFPLSFLPIFSPLLLPEKAEEKLKVTPCLLSYFAVTPKCALPTTRQATGIYTLLIVFLLIVLLILSISLLLPRPIPFLRDTQG